MTHARLEVERVGETSCSEALHDLHLDAVQDVRGENGREARWNSIVLPGRLDSTAYACDGVASMKTLLLLIR